MKALFIACGFVIMLFVAGLGIIETMTPPNKYQRDCEILAMKQ